MERRVRKVTRVGNRARRSESIGFPKTSGGKSHRLELLLEDFFLGGHFENYGEIPLWIESPYPAHPRDEVIAEIQSRNPVINLDGLNDDDLIDLYLRRDWGSGDWAQREREGRLLWTGPRCLYRSRCGIRR